MSFEQTKSESYRGKTTKVTRVQVASSINEKIASEQRRKANEEKIAERVNRVGNSKTRIAALIIMGSTDRINAVPYNTNKFEIRHDQEAYKEGFIEHGNREILGKMGELTDEQLQKIGTNDYISGIKIEEIPEKLKRNEAYSIGQIMGPIINSQNTESQGRGKK